MAPSRELRLNTIRDTIAHMNFRRALALRSANAPLVCIPREAMQNIVFRKAGAKVLLFFDMTKFFRKKMQKTCVIGKKSVILHDF